MRILRPLRVAGSLLLLLVSIPAWAADYHGQVFYHGVPVPGASVVMTHGAQHAATVTDDQGFYDFPHIDNGSWKIRIAMRGFATLKAEVTVASDIRQGRWDLKMLTPSRLLAMTKASRREIPPRLMRRTGQGSGISAAPANNEAAENSAGGLLINGTSNNAATSKYALPPSFGNHRPRPRGLYTGGFGAVVGNSAFDSRPYSITGLG
ncbi:MAG: carboxypeptidase-like regulatory domain-containing protein, partial [Terriglobia bacterium]